MSRNLSPSSHLPVRAVAVFDKGGAGSTLAVECIGEDEKTIPFVDADGVSWPHIVVDIPDGKASGLTYLINQTEPDGTNAVAGIPVGTGQLAIRVLTGEITLNSCGTENGAAGEDTDDDNYGIVGAGLAPSATSPFHLVAEEFVRLGRARTC